MTSDERVSPLTSGASQSADSVGEILRTNERTHEDISYPPFKSESSVPHARVLRDGEMEALYRIFDASGALLYIGRTRQWPTRMGQHEAGKSWWRTVSQITVQWHPTTDMALIEMRAIAAERPRHNITGNRLVDRLANRPTPCARPLSGINCGVCERSIAIGRIFFRVEALGMVCSRCTEDNDLYGEIVIPAIPARMSARVELHPEAHA